MCVFDDRKDKFNTFDSPYPDLGCHNVCRLQRPEIELPTPFNTSETLTFDIAYQSKFIPKNIIKFTISAIV